MSNKSLGSRFEKEFVDFLNSKGFWVHFCVPNAAGAQPCDVFAAKKGEAFLFDCKTCEPRIFRLNRLEVNQLSAFLKWGISNGYRGAFLAIKHSGKIYAVPFDQLYIAGKVELTDDFLFEKQVDCG